MPLSRRTALLALALTLATTLDNASCAHAHSFLGDWIRRVHAIASAVVDSRSSATDGGWFWGWGWGIDSTVSVVDRSPPVNFASRPASFGPLMDEPLLGYAIPMASFTVPCKSDKRKKRSGGHDNDSGDDDDRGWGSTKSVDSHYSGDDPDIVENLGCPKLCLAGKNKPTDSWIAFVQRGECQFVDKVREAQRFGARGVVVGGDDPDLSGNPDTLVNMYSQGK